MPHPRSGESFSADGSTTAQPSRLRIRRRVSFISCPRGLIAMRSFGGQRLGDAREVETLFRNESDQRTEPLLWWQPTANDAFGLTLGLGSIGLYGPGLVRGFNPQTAGNVRIDGLYCDQQGTLSNRVVEGSTIRIGVSEIGNAFPAPTGILDYERRLWRHIGS